MIIHPAQEGMQKAIEHMQSGGVLIYPTETSYAIGCKASDIVAVGNVFAIKERPVEKTVVMVVPSIEEAKRLMEWSDVAESLVAKHWPGPVTLVAPATEEGRRLAFGTIARDGTIALRVSSNPIAHALSEAVGPIVATSANRVGEPPCYGMDGVKKWLGETEDGLMVLNHGKLPDEPVSTIVRIVDGKCEILREGRVSKQIYE